MNKKQQPRLVEIRKEISRLTKELNTRFVKSDRDLHLQKLDEVIALFEEHDRIKRLDFCTAAGLRFLKSQAVSLRRSQEVGWSRRSYLKSSKRLTSKSDAKAAMRMMRK